MSKQLTPAVPLPPLPSTSLPATTVPKPAAPPLPVPQVSPATPPPVPSGAGSTSGGSLLSALLAPTAPTPPQSGPTVPTAPTTGVPTPGPSTAAPVVAVPPVTQTAQNFSALFPAFPAAPTPSTGTGGTNPPGFAAPTTAGIPLEEATRTGQVGSLMFGSPPKSDTEKVEPNVERGPQQAQAAPAPVTSTPTAPKVQEARAGLDPNLPPQKLPHPAILQDIGPDAFDKAKTLLARTGELATPNYVAAGLALVEIDPALMDMDIANTEEAQIYLDFLRETGTPWAAMTDKQKYTENICLQLLLNEADARLAQIGAIIIGATPIGISVTFNETAPRAGESEGQKFNRLVEEGVGVVAAHAAARETATPVSEVGAVAKAAEPQQSRELGQEIQPLEALVPPELLLLVDDGEDEVNDETEDMLGPDEYEDPKDNAAGIMARTAAEGEHFTGPKTTTGVPVTEAAIRPFVEIYASYILKKNLAAQGDVERKLGLDISKASNWKSYKTEDQLGTRQRYINDAVANLIRQGLGTDEKAKNEGQAKASGDAVERMRQKCANSAVGCDSPRHSHRQASGQCYEPKCPCKGRCQNFIEKGGGPEGGGKSTDANGGAASGATPQASAPQPGAGAGNPAGVVGTGATAPTSTAQTDKERAIAHIRKRMTEMRCVGTTEGQSERLCRANADVHQGYTGPLLTSGGSQGGHVACKGFTPSPQENTEFWALVNQGRALGLNIKLPKEVESGSPGQGAGGSQPGPGGMGSGVDGNPANPGPSGNQVRDDDGGRPGPGVGHQAGTPPVAGRGSEIPARPVGAPAGHPAQSPGVAEVEPAGVAPAAGLPTGAVYGGGGGAQPAQGVAGSVPAPGSRPPLPPPLPPRAEPAGHSGGQIATASTAPAQEDGHAEVPGQEAGPEEVGVEEVIRDITWAGGYVSENRIYAIGYDGYQKELDWWPVPEDLDAHEYTAVRRERAIQRVYAFWQNVTTVEVQQGPDAPKVRVFNGNTGINPRSTSYRTILAAKELSAQIERYAKAWRDHNDGATPVVPEDIEAALTEKMREAAVAYCEAHKPLPNGEPDTDFVTYMEACTTWNIEVGTSWAEIKKLLDEQAPVGLPAATEPSDDESPF